jgi:methanogenic corrinoid protein MtbC1
MTETHSISDVSRIAGIPKDLLRMWERRYGYPRPSRDSNGDRVYSSEQLDKLVLIRQLQAQGKRPGKLVKLDLAELQSLHTVPAVELDTQALLALLKSGSAAELNDWLQQQLQAHGLRSFIYKIMAPAINLLGEAWSRGELAIYQEHLCTQVMKSLIRQSLAEHDFNRGEPKIMLTTVPGEIHSLGLLMVESLLRLDGAQVVSFGTQMPFKDIQDAAAVHDVDIIGLSFSSAFKLDDALVMLSGLRQIIDPALRIWVGGQAFSAGDTMPDGVELLDGLHGAEIALADWRRSHPHAQIEQSGPR